MADYKQHPVYKIENCADLLHVQRIIFLKIIHTTEATRVHIKGLF